MGCWHKLLSNRGPGRPPDQSIDCGLGNRQYGQGRLRSSGPKHEPNLRSPGNHGFAGLADLSISRIAVPIHESPKNQ